MDLQSLEKRTRINRRKLRYCIDHQLVPGSPISVAVDESGRARRFSEDTGFGIVCAACLLDLGLKHEMIRRFIRGLLQLEFPGPGYPQSVLVAAMEKNLEAFADFGDGVYVRIRSPEIKYDSGWLEIDTRQVPEEYQPRIIVTLNLGLIREQVFGPLPMSKRQKK